MSEVFNIAGEPRGRIGKGGARAARRAGRLPGIVYGDGKDPVPVSLDTRTVVRELDKAGFFTTLMDLKFGKDTIRVLPRELQYHPVTDVPLHIDLLRVGAKTIVTIAVPVVFLNEEDCTGLRRGGVLNVVRYEVDLVCQADSIPARIEVDLTGLDIGDSVHVSHVSLPDGVTPTITDRDFTIATIAAPTVVTAEEEEGVVGEEGEEGEEGVVEEGAEEAAEGKEG